MPTAPNQSNVMPAGRARMVALIVTAFLPFAIGYHLSYIFRAINALISDRLIADLQLDAAQLGLLTSAYFLSATLAMLPLGFALDRHGPGRVQGVCLLIAAAGAALFATATDFIALFVGRLLIGVGVATAFMAGLKAIVMWFPKERVPVLNGILVAAGAAGALAVAAPLDALLAYVSWRTVFWGLAMAAAASGILVLALVPAVPPSSVGLAAPASVSLGQIAARADFWRLAPLSAMVIGSAGALQGLWVAPWLRDVARYDGNAISVHLTVMACALCAGALGLGVAIERLRKRGIETQTLLAGLAVMFVAAEIALGLGLSFPTLLPCAIIGFAAAATVISYSAMAELFPKEAAGRANCLLNLMHFGVATIVQFGFGAIVALWAKDDGGHYPTDAYGAALLVLAVLQLAALAWFAKPVLAKVSARQPTRFSRQMVGARTTPVLVLADPRRIAISKRRRRRENG